MAKVSFTKLGCKRNTDVEIVNFNGVDIEIKKAIPIAEKATIVANVLYAAFGDQRYPNPIRKNMFLTLEKMYAYTNINFTDKQKEEPSKLYDMIMDSGLYAAVARAVEFGEFEIIDDYVDVAIEDFMTYNNSAYGIIESIGQDFSKTEMDASEIQKKLTENPQALAFLHEVMDKMG